MDIACPCVFKILTYRLMIKNPEVLPDVTDSNYYCKACEKTLNGIYSFRKYLGFIHNLLEIPKFQEKPKDILLILMILTFTAAFVIKKLSARFSFNSHLLRLHSIGIQLFKDGSLEPDSDDPNSLCRACNRTFINKKAYRSHLVGVHKMALQPNGNAIPKFLQILMILTFIAVYAKEQKNRLLYIAPIVNIFII